MHKLLVLNGPEMGQSFKLKDGPTFVGRSDESDISIEDKTVSRKHLKITRKKNKFFITDLESENGTYIGGDVITGGLEVEVEEGVTITIGMCMICLGEDPTEQMTPFLDPVGFNEDVAGQSGLFAAPRDKSNQKKLEFLSNVSEVIEGNLSTNSTLAGILDCILALLKRIDRVAFILVDPETEKILDVVSKSKQSTEDTYCTDVVTQVIKDTKPVAVSNVRTEKQDSLVDTLKILKIESVMCVPIFSDSKIIGLIYVDSLGRPHGFRKGDLSLFIELSQMTAPVVKEAISSIK